MARLFDDASSQYLAVGSTPVTAAPFSMAAWFNSDSDALQQAIISVGDTAGATNYFTLQARGNTGGDPVQVHVREGATSAVASTSSGYSANTWHHAAAVFASSSSHAVYLDGANKGTNAEFISCITPEGRMSKVWLLWTRAMQVLKRKD